MESSVVERLFKSVQSMPPQKRGKVECFSGALVALAAIGFYASYGQRFSRAFRIMTGASGTFGIALLGHGIFSIVRAPKKRESIDQLFKGSKYSFETLPEYAGTFLASDKMTDPIMKGKKDDGCEFIIVKLHAKLTTQNIDKLRKEYRSEYINSLIENPRIEGLLAIMQCSVGCKQWKELADGPIPHLHPHFFDEIGISSETGELEGSYPALQLLFRWYLSEDRNGIVWTIDP